LSVAASPARAIGAVGLSLFRGRGRHRATWCLCERLLRPASLLLRWDLAWQGLDEAASATDGTARAFFAPPRSVYRSRFVMQCLLIWVPYSQLQPILWMNLEALLANLFTWMKVFNVCSRCMRHVVPDFDAVLVHFQFECVPDFSGV